jgi:hypothetical protein
VHEPDGDDRVFSVDQVVSLAGDDPMNEDVAGWTAGAAWVIDGATPLGEPYTAGPLTSAAWFAQRLSAQFAALSADPTGMGPATLGAAGLVRATQARLATQIRAAGLGGTRYPPSASAVYLAVAAGQVQVAVVGDVEALAVRRTGQAELVSNHLEGRLVPGPDGHPVRWGDIADLHEQRQAILHDHDGAHVLTLPPLHPAAMATRSFAAAELSRVLLFSDGFGRLRKLGQEPALTAMATGELSLCQAGLTLRELEKDIHVAPPEEKNSDDATAVLLSFPAG